MKAREKTGVLVASENKKSGNKSPTKRKQEGGSKMGNLLLASRKKQKTRTEETWTKVMYLVCCG